MAAGLGGVSRASLTPTWSTLGFQEAGGRAGLAPGSSKRVRGAEPFTRSDGEKMGIQLHCGQEGEDNRMELGKTHLESVCPL